jgi:hypothetical protein
MIKKESLIFISSAILILVFCSSAHAIVVTSCSGSEGYAYFFSGKFVPSNQEGWQPDHISTGGIIFTIDEEKPDIIIRDATGRTRSVKEDKALVQVLHSEPSKGTILVMVYYPAGALEHYLFQLNIKGTGKVVWGTAKAAGPIITNKLMVADCKKQT